MTRSPDSQVPSGAGQPATEKRDDKAFKCRQEGEANLRANTSERRISIVSSTSNQADSAGLNSGASLSLEGEACYGSEALETSEAKTEPPGRCTGRWHAETAHSVNRRDPVRSAGENSKR
jgi:hypothetical protein